jgi:DNA invertase Pin-like site-specific DNA recombinase
MQAKAALSERRVVGYIRVSLEKQADGGGSLEAQREKLELFARLHDLVLVDVFVDAGASAKSLDRPALDAARAALRSGRVSGLLVAKLDRLTRSVRDLDALVTEHFASGRTALISIGESVDTRSAAGRLVLNVLTSVAQWEREAIGERTSTVMRSMRARGEFTGGHAPFGQRVDACGELVDHPGECVTIARVGALRAEGVSLAGIARVLTAEGHVGRSGRPLAKAQVARIVQTHTKSSVALEEAA